jgi:hypothetical protein
MYVHKDFNMNLNTDMTENFFDDSVPMKKMKVVCSGLKGPFVNKWRGQCYETVIKTIFSAANSNQKKKNEDEEESCGDRVTR